MKVYLIRHAEYANPENIIPGRLPVELSETGIKMAKKLQKYFIDKEISLIYSSRVYRCKKTAEIISSGNILIKFDVRLLEILSAYQGFSFGNCKIDWSYLQKFVDELGGENFDDIQKRVIEFWNEKIVNATKDVIVCSHGDPLYVLIQYLLKEEIVARDTHQALGNYPPKASITIFEKVDEEFKFVDRILVENI